MSNTLTNLLNDLRLDEQQPLQIVVNLLMALVLSLATSFVYRKTHSGYAYSRSFNITLVVVAMVITMIMVVISNHLALSLGLVGSLSVIRFRSAIKEPKDIAYLFLSIAIGLSCSIGSYLSAILGTIVIDGTLLTLHFLRFGAGTQSAYSLSFLHPKGQEEVEKIVEEIKQQFREVVFRSYAQISEELGEYIYSVRLDKVSGETATQHLQKTFPNLKQVTLIAPETNLEI